MKLCQQRIWLDDKQHSNTYCMRQAGHEGKCSARSEADAMSRFVTACLAIMDPKPAVAVHVGNLAVFAVQGTYMTARVAATEDEVKLVTEEWGKACKGNHDHENPALNSGPCDGRVTGTSSSVN